MQYIISISFHSLVKYSVNNVDLLFFIGQSYREHQENCAEVYNNKNSISRGKPLTIHYLDLFKTMLQNQTFSAERVR